MARRKASSSRMVIADVFGRGAPRRSWVLFVAIVVFVLLGGGSRDDVLSLLILRPLSILVLGYAIYVAAPIAWERHRIAAVGVSVMVAIHIAQLIPLPPAFWTALAGRMVVAETLSAAELPLGWRPLSLVPFQTWNSLFALSAPIAVWLLAVSLDDRRYLARMVAACLVLAIGSALLGLLQVASGYDSGLYFYRITNNGLAVGLFANRNHNGFFLATAVPMAAYLVGQAQRAGASSRMALSALALLVVLMLFGVVLAGSRGALILFAIGLMAALLFIELPTLQGRRLSRGGLLIGAVVISVLAVVVAYIPTNAVSRLGKVAMADELRLAIWPIAWREVWTYFPWGGGFGTFVEVYQLVEPTELLRQQYVNHAHNDWLEILMDAGLGGGLLLFGAVALWGGAVTRVIRAKTIERLPLLGVVVIGMLGCASFLDYPLRTPALASVMALAAGWATSQARGEREPARGRAKVND